MENFAKMPAVKVVRPEAGRSGHCEAYCSGLRCEACCEARGQGKHYILLAEG